MEHSSNSTAITVINNEQQMAADIHKLPKKKRSAMHLLRVALYMIRRKSGKSKTPVHVDVASRGPWKKVLGAIRPFHLQSNQSPPPMMLDIEAQGPPMTDHFEDVMFSPPKYVATTSTSSSSVDGMSQYASAVNLQELDEGMEDEDEDEDEEDVHYDGNAGDEMIDTKAEEFINNFYAQMRIQHREYMAGQNSYNQGIQTQVMRG